MIKAKAHASGTVVAGCRSAGVRFRWMLALRATLRAALWAAAFAAVAAVMKVTPAAARQRDRRDGVLEDELFLRPCLQNHRILVEALDPPCQFDSAHQVDGDVAAFFSGTVEKAVLDCVLLRWFFHLLRLPRSKKFSRVLQTYHR